jgi:two-component system chemotaxis sensor kinase CheA
MDREELTRRLMVTFLEELEEHTNTMNQGLLALEAQRETADPELLTTLFRTAHSLKGAARSVGVIPVEQACHELEEILAKVRDGHMQLSSAAFEVLFSAIDGVTEVGRRLRHAETLTDAPLRTLVSKLESVRNGTPGSEPESPRRRRPEPSPRAVADAAPSEEPKDEAPDSAPASIAPAAGDAANRRVVESTTVRVAAEKLDRLLAQSGDVLATRGRIESRVHGVDSIRDLVSSWRSDFRLIRKPLRAVPGVPARTLAAVERAGETLSRVERELERFVSLLTGDVRALGQTALRLDEEVRRARMVPFAEACEGMQRTVRDLCAERDKQAELVIVGGELEIDRFIAQRLRDPLNHLVRNAVDHGLETVNARTFAGKPAKGIIKVSAVLRGPFIDVSVEDDGAGVELGIVSKRAKERGLPEPEHERDIGRLIFMHGFSTARRVTEVSGRGVGLDAVKAAAESLHGAVEFSSEPGKGTRFAMRVPLTLTTLRVLVIRVGNQVFAVATTSVVRVLSASTADRMEIHGKDMLRTATGPIPFVSLAASLSLPQSSGEIDKTTVVVMQSGETAAFAVDELIAEHEVVVKNLGARLRRVKNVSGAAVLPSGRLVLILSAAELVRQASTLGTVTRLPLRTTPKKRRLLVVDDTVTTRTLVKSILEGAGYDITTAADGVEAVELLTSRPFDLVVSDVEMPRMDGFTLTRTIRATETLAEMPVILVTALASDAHKKSGLEAGANAYLIKAAFDQQNLLDAIRELV